jgi:hypothetical protein
MNGVWFELVRNVRNVFPSGFGLGFVADSTNRLAAYVHLWVSSCALTTTITRGDPRRYVYSSVFPLCSPFGSLIAQKMVSHLTNQVRPISEVTNAVAGDDLGKLVNDNVLASPTACLCLGFNIVISMASVRDSVIAPIVPMLAFLYRICPGSPFTSTSPLSAHQHSIRVQRPEEFTRDTWPRAGPRDGES